MQQPWEKPWKTQWEIHRKSMENKNGKKGNVSLVLHAPQKNIVFGLKNWDPI